jgi:uncharacterized protein YutE (UPF0331/DUF86 family)
MVISSLNIKLLEDRLRVVNETLMRLKRFGTLSEEDFFKGDNPAAVESYLRRSLEAIFDIGRHILAKVAGKGIVEYKEIARELGIKGVITQDLASRLIIMAGYRNRLVHFYHMVTDRELYDIVKGNLGDAEDYIREIKDFLENYIRRLKDE